MIRISVEVRDGGAAFTTAVCAESIREAVLVAKDHYPGSAVGVVFPIEPEGFFVRDPRSDGLVREDHAA